MQMVQKLKSFLRLIKTPVGMAVAILVAIVGYVTLGVLFGGDNANGTTAGPTAASEKDDLFFVKVRTMTASEYTEDVQVRGRTEALKKVALKAEEEGRIIATPVDKGAHVKKGQTICQIATNEREANLAQAQALAAEKVLQYNANLELAKKGFRSETQVANAKADLDAATAQVSRAQIALANTKITAPFDGLLNERNVEIGDFMQKGTTCGVILTENPYLVVGEVSDRQVSGLVPGTPARVELTDGTMLDGHIRYVSNEARIETRTYRVEVQVENPNGDLRDGMTANIKIPAREVKAYFLPLSVLVLKDDGTVGIRTVEGTKVAFYPVEIIGNLINGMWVKGLPNEITLITVGQNFVSEGEEVRVEFEADGGQ